MNEGEKVTKAHPILQLVAYASESATALDHSTLCVISQNDA